MSISDYNTALVTGASSGVGAACVRSLRKAGLEVVAVARREDRLAQLADETGCEIMPLDLTDTDALYEKLGDRAFDVLINNAGMGRGHDGFFNTPPNDIEEMIDLNVIAAVHVVRAIAAGMRDRSRGHIIQIGSVVGLHTLGFPAYSATKGAIHSFGHSLRMEFKGTRVRHTEICPGRIETEFFDAAFKTAEEKEEFLSGYTLLKPENIADTVLFALEAPWHVNISLIELTPTEQIPGGASIESARSE